MEVRQDQVLSSYLQQLRGQPQSGWEVSDSWVMTVIINTKKNIKNKINSF